MTGERTDRHPLFDQFLQQYVDKENETIKRFNDNVDNIEYHDLFESTAQNMSNGAVFFVITICACVC